MFIMLYKVVPLYDTVLLGGTKAMSLLKGTAMSVKSRRQKMIFSQLSLGEILKGGAM